MKILKTYKKGKIYVKHVADDYVLEHNQTFADATERENNYVHLGIVNNKYVELATLEEIKAHNQQLQQQADAQFQARKKADGIRYADEINTKIIGIMRGKSQSEMDTLDIEFRVRILKYLDLVEGGDWWTARRMIDNISLPKLQEIKTLFLKVRSDIRNYVNENYK